MTAHDVLTEAFDQAVEELDGFVNRIVDEPRTIRAVECPDGRWCAMTGEDRLLFPPAPREITERFVAAFARLEARFVVAPPEFSVKVPDLHVVR